MAKNIRVVQAGVNTTNGNAQALGAGFKIASVKMPVQQKKRAWHPSWHPSNPINNLSVTSK